MAMNARKISQEIKRLKERAVQREQKFQALESEISSKQAAREQQTAVQQEIVKRKALRVLKNSVGRRFERVEAVLLENESLLTDKDTNVDKEEDFLAFKEAILLSRSHYVHYAVAKGFRSIHRTFDDFGTALHHAVRLGSISSTEELLIHGASPNIRSRLGNFPLHDVWVAFKRSYPHGKLSRLKEASSMCAHLIKLLCSYGSYVDHKDILGNTCLIYATQFQLIECVVLLLGFKADLSIVNSEGLSALDYAKLDAPSEIFSLFQSWESISKQFKKEDFHSLWNKFLSDPSATISSDLNAAEFLETLPFQLENRPKKLSSLETDIRIEDELLEDAIRKDEEEAKNATKGGTAIIIKAREPEKVVHAPLSLRERRCRAAACVANDGTFLQFTKRPAMSSALLASLRTSDVPTLGTCEVTRETYYQALLSEKGEENTSSAGAAKTTPSKNFIGAYNQGVLCLNPSAKQSMNNQLVRRDHGFGYDAKDVNRKNSIDGMVGTKTDLLEDRRSRFVSPELLPHPKPNSCFPAFSADGSKPKSIYPLSVNYGRGRLQSTHNFRGVLENPWSTVNFDYRTVSTDRTV